MQDFRTYHVVNPHDDGISMDDFVDWMVASGRAIQRVDDYDDWLARFETALKALPEKERHQSFLPLLHRSPSHAGDARGGGFGRAFSRVCAARRGSVPSGTFRMFPGADPQVPRGPGSGGTAELSVRNRVVRGRTSALRCDDTTEL